MNKIAKTITSQAKRISRFIRTKKIQFQTVSKKEQLSVILVTIALVFLIGLEVTDRLRASGIINSQTPREPSVTSKVKPATTPTKCQENPYLADQLSYSSSKTITDRKTIDKIRFILKDDEYARTSFKIPTDKYIEQIAYADKTNQVVYLLVTPAEGNIEENRVLMLVDLATQQQTKLFEKQTNILYPNRSDELKDQLISFSLNSNGSQMLIFTESEIFLYNLEKRMFTKSFKSLKTKYSQMYDGKTYNFFVKGFFSDDENKVLLQWGEHSGSLTFVFDLKTEQLTEISKPSSSALDLDVFGWIGDQVIYTDLNAFEKANNSSTIGLCIDSVSFNNARCLPLDNSVVDMGSFRLSKDYVATYTTQQLETENTNCIDGTTIAYKTTLYLISTSEFNKETVFSSIGASIINTALITLDGHDYIVIQFSSSSTSTLNYALVDLKQRNQLIKLYLL